MANEKAKGVEELLPKEENKRVLNKEVKTVLLLTVFAVIAIAIGVFSIQVYKEQAVVGGAYYVKVGMSPNVSLSSLPYPFIEPFGAVSGIRPSEYSIYNTRFIVDSYDDSATANRLSMDLENRVAFCKDSDYGRDYYNAGTVRTYVMPGIFNDICTDRVLTEYSCYGTKAAYETYICPEGCSANGKSCNPEEPADGYRMFITSTTYNGNLGGLEGADAKCNEVAAAANLSGRYKAWISTSAVNAKDRLFHASVPYVMLNGTKIADNWNDLVDANIAVPIKIDQTGNLISARDNVWTGTQRDGTASPPYEDQDGKWTNNCADWTFSGSSDDGEIGTQNSATYQWTDAGTRSCNESQRLYCFEQPTVAPNPMILFPLPGAGPNPMPIWPGPILFPVPPAPWPGPMPPGPVNPAAPGPVNPLPFGPFNPVHGAAIPLAAGPVLPVAVALPASEAADFDMSLTGQDEITGQVYGITSPGYGLSTIGIYDPWTSFVYPNINFNVVFANDVQSISDMHAVLFAGPDAIPDRFLPAALINDYAARGWVRGQAEVSLRQNGNYLMLFIWGKTTADRAMAVNVLIDYLNNKAKYPAFANSEMVCIEGAPYKASTTVYAGECNPAPFRCPDKYCDLGLGESVNNCPEDCALSPAKVYYDNQLKMNFEMKDISSIDLVPASIQIKVNGVALTAEITETGADIFSVKADIISSLYGDQKLTLSAPAYGFESEFGIGTHYPNKVIEHNLGEFEYDHTFYEKLSAEATRYFALYGSPLTGYDFEAIVIDFREKTTADYYLAITTDSVPKFVKNPETGVYERFDFENKEANFVWEYGSSIILVNSKETAQKPEAILYAYLDRYPTEEYQPNVPPVIDEDSSVTPAMGIAGQPFDIYLIATDEDAGLNKIRYQIKDGTESIVSEAEAISARGDSIEYTWTIAGLPEGQYTITLTATDVDELSAEKVIQYRVAAGAVPGNVSDYIIEQDIGNYTFTNYSGSRTEAEGTIYYGDYDKDGEEYKVTIFSADSQSGLYAFLAEIDEEIAGEEGTKQLTVIDGNVVYVVKSGDDTGVYWTSGLNVVIIGYPTGLEMPLDLIKAYLAKYPSDLGEISTAYDMKTGWNLVSIPVVLANRSIENAFAPIMDNAEQIYAYRSAGWKVWNAGAPTLSDLNQVDLGYAYWVKMKNPEAFNIQGSMLLAAAQEGQFVSPPIISLTKGWNLIGVHAKNRVLASDYLGSIRNDRAGSVYRYVTVAGQEYGTLDTVADTEYLEPGEGYWIYLIQDGVLVP